MKDESEAISREVFVERVVCAVYAESTCQTACTLFSIQHSAFRKGPDGCAGSQPGPQTVKNWLFPKRVFPIASETTLP